MKFSINIATSARLIGRNYLSALFRTLAVALTICSITSAPVQAESDHKARQESELKHTPPSLAEIPPGTPLTLDVELTKSSNARRPLRLYAVRDGKPFETTIAEATYNTKERPIYSFSITAPIAELRYQFFLEPASSPSTEIVTSPTTTIESPPYVVQRDCIATSVLNNITLNDQATETIQRASTSVNAIVALSRDIEEEGLALEQARKTLEEILQLTSSAQTARKSHEE